MLLALEQIYEVSNQSRPLASRRYEELSLPYIRNYVSNQSRPLASRRVNGFANTSAYVIFVSNQSRPLASRRKVVVCHASSGKTTFPINRVPQRVGEQVIARIYATTPSFQSIASPSEQETNVMTEQPTNHLVSFQSIASPSEQEKFECSRGSA